MNGGEFPACRGLSSFYALLSLSDAWVEISFGKVFCTKDPFPKLSLSRSKLSVTLLKTSPKQIHSSRSKLGFYKSVLGCCFSNLDFRKSCLDLQICSCLMELSNRIRETFECFQLIFNKALQLHRDFCTASHLRCCFRDSSLLSDVSTLPSFFTLHLLSLNYSAKSLLAKCSFQKIKAP
ncbi:hypothetical protein HQ39_08325 [Porphyromonas sp. COT-108 OH2963]|nr:hypothetical protein HQ39_08325 [Porphyromonas sp. COT-108 OH2963]